MQHQGTSWITAVLPFVVIAIVLALRFRSMSRERPLRIATLWIVPVIYLLIAGSMMFAVPPSPPGWGLLALGLVIGIAVGWHRGKLIRIERDPDSGELRQRASPLAMLLLVALVVHGAMLLTDAFIGFALGLLSATRLELYLRARRILAV